ncbi:OmpA family protein [Pedobacter sp. KR3-3]|uniref:OmpA family protein n=1 Tax=Pedobacter albus TaxID=3113905 RepID=A0ABU7I5W7_9SPHI|nr:OmpA family protein [Pedobacter sp. KR3-3]MEE1944862.1 OmpA family protein [Pedobacter sp. KR3-3]
MKYKKILLVLAVALLAATTCRAQYVLKEGDEQYKLFNYKKAVGLYEQAYRKKPSLEAAERLADCYVRLRDFTQAESWYAIVSNKTDSKPKNVLAYTKALQQNSKYAEAKIAYRKYADLEKGLKAGELETWLMGCDSAMRWMATPQKIDVENRHKLNSPTSDWGVGLYLGGITFASDRGNATGKDVAQERPFLKFDGYELPDRVVYGWTGNAYLKLYASHAKDSVSLFPLAVTSNYHVGPATFTADGNEMYFTLTRISPKPAFEKDGLATVNIGIYSSRKGADGQWSAPVAFPYNNSNAYSMGDPFITNDGKRLYFVSDRPGGLGGTDVYVCWRNEAGSWGNPINLKEINTAGNERTPFFDERGYLYFSSDGFVGMGGLDIFVARMVNGKSVEVKNLGYPINSPQDDFAYMKTNELQGYLSSNRLGGAGSDDIYSFVEQAQPSGLRLVGRALDKISGRPLANTIVTLSGVKASPVKVQTDSTGNFGFDLQKGNTYSLSGEKTDYMSDNAPISTDGVVLSTMKKDLLLERVAINKAIKLENIYYDFDKSNIRAEAAIELDKLVKIMKENPTIWIELGSHTDSRGNDQYNLALSQRRADAAVKYIVDRGISPNRIFAMGYGASQLLNHCKKGVECTEAEHQLNRRTEFKIVKQ